MLYFLKIFFILLSIFLLTSCHPNKITLEQNYNDIKDNDVIVFIPGYKGSKLLDSHTKETVWLSLGEILFEEHSLELKNDNQITVGNVFDRLTVVPGLYNIDIYEDCLNSLSKINPERKIKTKIIVFTYDWRLSNVKNAEKLEDFLVSINSKKAKSISVIAHSMGGLSLSYLLSKNHDLPKLKNIVFLTVPFRGTVTAFIDMHRKLPSMLFNDTLLNREVFSSFESAYEFLPHPDDYTLNDLSEKNEETLFNIAAWDKYSWGILKDFELKKDVSTHNFLEENLKRSLERYRMVDNAKPSCPTNKITNIYGKGIPVKGSVRSDFIEHLDEVDEESAYLKKVDGDILISSESSKLPKSFQNCEYEEVVVENLVHDRACNNSQAFEVIKRALFGN